MTETFRPTPALRAASSTGAPASFAPSGGSSRRCPRSTSATASSALDTGAFEYADALGKFLPDADRPNEGVFALQDDDEQWMALRYDLTAPLARFAAQNWETLPKPFRRYAFGTVWRNEKPGPGRCREFIQCDADTVGSARPEADAEMIAMAVEGFEAAGLPPGRLCAEDQQPQAAQRPADRRRRRRRAARSWPCCARSTSWTGWARTACAAARRGPQGRVRRLHQGRGPGRHGHRGGAGLRRRRRGQPRGDPGRDLPTWSAARPRATRAWRSCRRSARP